MKKLLWIALSIGLSTQLLSATSVTPLSSGKAIDGFVKQKEKKYYNITVPNNKSIRVNLTPLDADVDLYVKKGNEVRVRFNDCFSSNSNTENEECIVTNEGKSSIYTILVNGFKESAFTLKASIEAAEEIPTLTSDPIADAVEQKEGKQYRLEGKKGEPITVTLSDLTGNADLRVRVGRKAGLHSFNCKSINRGTKTEECVIKPKKDDMVYVHVYGRKAASYSLKAVKGTTNPCITREELETKIANNDDVTKVNTSCITDMSGLFYFNRNFNQDISSWDVSHVTNMNHMFSNTEMFNQNLSSWDTSNVENMNNMFSYATAFKGHDLSSWNVAKVFEQNWFLYSAGQKNIEPKWNINKAMVNKAKEHCLNNNMETNTVICLPKKIAYVVRTEDDIGGSMRTETILYKIDINTESAQYITQSGTPDGRLSLKSLKGFPFVATSSEIRLSTNSELIFRNSNGEEQKGLDLTYYSIKEIKPLENGKKLSIKHEKLDVYGNEGPILYENIYEMTTPSTMKLISEKKL